MPHPSPKTGRISFGGDMCSCGFDVVVVLGFLLSDEYEEDVDAYPYSLA